MTSKTIISAQELQPHLQNPDWAVIDCQFSLQDTQLGFNNYKKGHIPGAVYAHLDDDLAGEVIPDQTGRHPLPQIETLTQTLSNWGIADRVQVVAYDNFGGGIAARLWWMLRWLGHTAVAVLDGAIDHWKANDYPLTPGIETRPTRTFQPKQSLLSYWDTETLLAMRNNSDYLIIDSRNHPRFLGHEEPYDPVAGHIPGAVNAFYQDNLSPEGLFLDKETLHTRFSDLLGDTPTENTIFYCGSGVTACHNILALQHAGLGSALLYPGSWSEWVIDPNRPVATGEG